MFDTLELLASAVIIGCGETLVMDVWGVVQRRLLGIASLDYAMVGRWLGHMPNGVFRHAPILPSLEARNGIVRRHGERVRSLAIALLQWCFDDCCHPRAIAWPRLSMNK